MGTRGPLGTTGKMVGTWRGQWGHGGETAGGGHGRIRGTGLGGGGSGRVGGTGGGILGTRGPLGDVGDEVPLRPQMWACALGHREAAERLCHWDPRALAVPDTLGRLPLGLARARGHLALVTRLEELQPQLSPASPRCHLPAPRVPSPLSASPDTGMAAAPRHLIVTPVQSPSTCPLTAPRHCHPSVVTVTVSPPRSWPLSS